MGAIVCARWLRGRAGRVRVARFESPFSPLNRQRQADNRKKEMGAALLRPLPNVFHTIEDMAQARIHIPLPAALRMIVNYAGVRLRDQVKSVAFIVIYLTAFQLLVFGAAPDRALRVAGGIAAVVVGLALFLEGLLLGLIPLAKRVGVKLSGRGGLKIILPVGLLLGVGSTLAEPAMASLRAAGAGVAAWEAPLLFYLVQTNPQLLIAAIGVGVGVAVAVGMLRFYIGFSIKPLIVVIVLALLALTVLWTRWPNLAMILALAWDS